jgi:hypothetical protein
MIVSNYERMTYKEKAFYSCSVYKEIDGRRIGFMQSFDHLSDAVAWAGEKVRHLDTYGVPYPLTADSVLPARAETSPMSDSVLSAQAPAHEAQACRCCSTDMGGSDHCPQCGCEEYEETCGEFMRDYHQGNRPRPGVFDMRKTLGRAPTAQEYRDER